MQKPHQPFHSHLFTVRVWLEDLGEGRSEWRGKVRDVASGEEHYFRDGPTLYQWLLFMAAGQAAPVEEAIKDGAKQNW